VAVAVASPATNLQLISVCSLTVSALDSDLAALWDSPVHTAALRWGV